MLPKYQKIKFTTGDKITESLGDRPFTVESAKGYGLKLKVDNNTIDVGTDGHIALDAAAQIDFGGEGPYIRLEDGDLVVSGNANAVIVRSGNLDYEFGTDGVLTLPEGGSIVDSNGDPITGGQGGVSGDPRLTIHGYLDGVTVPGTAQNYVTFTTGDVAPTGLYLTRYESADTRAFFALQEGPQWTASQTEYSEAMLAAGHFGPAAEYANALGVNILDAPWGGYQLQPNTTYTMWIQQINAICEYAFSTSVNDNGFNAPITYSSAKLSPTQISFYDVVGTGPAVLSENSYLSNTTLQGNTTVGPLLETLRKKSGAGLTVVHDFKTTSTWYHVMISQNFTPNFTNLPTENDRVIECKLILNQGATPYIPNAIKISGTDTTVNWLGSTLPSGTANKKDLVTFTFVRTGSVWIVLGKLETYGSA
jgi:hypothetical protein